MKIQIEPILANFLATSELNVDISKLKEYCYSVQKIEPNGVKRSNFCGWQSNPLILASAPSELRSFFDILYEAINGVHAALGFRNTYHQIVDGMWININKKNNSNLTHTHPNCYFSGVFYVSVPKDSGRIVFQNPMNEIKYTYATEHIELFNEFNSSDYSVTPVDGLLVMFPSWLPHYVEPSNSEEDRISFAFNTSIMLKHGGEFTVKKDNHG